MTLPRLGVNIDHVATLRNARGEISKKEINESFSSILWHGISPWNILLKILLRLKVEEKHKHDLTKL